MAYDRYDSRDQNRGYRDDRSRDDRSGYRNNDGDDRGFFQRAADEVSSWFGDESSGGRRERDDRYGRSNESSRRYETRSDNEQRGYTAGQGGWGSSSSTYEPRAYDESESGGRYGRDNDRSAFFSGGQSSSYGRGRDQGDYQNQYGRGGGESGGFGGGNYGRQDSSRSDYGSRSSSYGQSGNSSFGQSQSFDRNRDDLQGRGHQSQGGDRYRPMTGDYGRGQSDRGSGFGSQDYGQQQYGRQDRFQDQDRDTGRSSMFGGQTQFGRGTHDDHYSSWRQRQIEDLDRDYDEYRREHQSRFENEFSSFRATRQTKRQMLGQIREHAEVVDENGERIGTVDKVRGDKIILTKNDPEANGVHRSFTCSLLEKVEDGKVTLSGTKDSIRSRLQEERDEGQQGGMMGGLFGGSDNDRQQDRSASSLSTTSTSTTGTTGQSSDGPHMLDKSFSGTYDDSSETK
ncbi:hypothetical protein GCM10022281_17450 [Sphingomonas rosea]|uniref:DUF2171 domain-containing protein n=1 Tax=Sphingomonas rosea TaxID=335605 RepID=A0ABP7U7D5_9SPHN